MGKNVMLEAEQLIRAGATRSEQKQGGNLGGRANIIDENTKQTIKRNPWFIYSHRSALEVGERTFRVWWRDSLGKQPE